MVKSSVKVTSLLSAAVLRLENRQQAQSSPVRRDKAKLGDHRQPGAGERVLVEPCVEGPNETLCLLRVLTVPCASGGVLVVYCPSDRL